MLRQLLLVTWLAILWCQTLPVWSQARATATPVAAALITPTPEGQKPLPPTATATLSPSPLPAVRLRALSTAGNINVRAQPNLESEVLGFIADVKQYEVLRNYYRWYEFRFDDSPNGRGWVYGDLVEILGDQSLIEVIENAADIERPGQADTLLAPEAEDAAERRIAISTVRADSAQSVELGIVTALPTFTRPAPTPASPIDQIQTEAGIESPLPEIPPILPIAVLGGIGILGLLISALRP